MNSTYEADYDDMYGKDWKNKTTPTPLAGKKEILEEIENDLEDFTPRHIMDRIKTIVGFRLEEYASLKDNGLTNRDKEHFKERMIQSGIIAKLSVSNLSLREAAEKHVELLRAIYTIVGDKKTTQQKKLHLIGSIIEDKLIPINKGTKQ